MIILVLTISLVLCLVFAYLTENDSRYIRSNCACATCIISGLIAVLSLIVAVVLAIFVIEGGATSKRIAMYEEQNQQIETDIAELVNTYMTYESDTLANFTPDNAVTLVSMYPELKSDTLVEQQCNLYIKNNEKITQLKDSQVSMSVWKWWLYFGK